VIATRLENPDFVALAAACGAHAEAVEETDGVVPALERALAANRPALLALRVDPEAITPDRTIADLRGSTAG
jgi:acetolactate synthase-1/2/3 large subunit